MDPAPPAADPTGVAGLAIGQSSGGAAWHLCHLGAPAAGLNRGLRAIGWAKAVLLGTMQLGITDCRPFKGRMLWWSRWNYVPEQATPSQDAMDCRLGRSRRQYEPEEQHDFRGWSHG